MPTPKKKTSRSKRDMRRSHDGLEMPAVGFDKKTGEFHKPHHAHKTADGAYYYKGKQILPPKVKKEAKEETATNE
ncbi:MAG: 50S ribosomal protein L32 [Bdellovibrionaceae bacterium]|nr:50S ribosomal protein L32 [Pseudobdellovibrionaceae bacterium]NUM58199.1 50S ribosomal protein L32 [Pseudobdellovibrionaceae bacterium]